MRRRRPREFRPRRRFWLDRLCSFASDILTGKCRCGGRRPPDEEWNALDQESSDEEAIEIDDPRPRRHLRAVVAPELDLDVGPPQRQQRAFHALDMTSMKVHRIPAFGSITTIFTYVDAQITRAKTLQPPQHFVRITSADIRQAVGYSPPPQWIDTGLEAAARKNQAVIIEEHHTSEIILDWRVENFDELSQHLNQPLGVQGA